MDLQNTELENILFHEDPDTCRKRRVMEVNQYKKDMKMNQKNMEMNQKKKFNRIEIKMRKWRKGWENGKKDEEMEEMMGK